MTPIWLPRARQPQWFDLFHMRGTRRDFLRVGAGAAALAMLGGAHACAPGEGRRLRRVASNPFTLGVASGDPLPDSVVLWTRLARDVLDAAGALGDAVEVDYEVSDTDTFRRIIRRGTILARPELGHSAHAEVMGLEPGRTYFYRWIAGGEASPVGRTRTAPLPDTPLDRFRFAFASCQQYEHGYYTAYRHMSEEDLDLVVHLGDYIYERTWGENLVRHHEGPEIMTLDDYRARYTTYRSDPDLQAAHAAAPWVVTWDDHEVDNNYADGIPEDDQPRDAFLLRRAAAYQAYYELMPLRRSSLPSGPDMQLYRALRFGNLLDMSVLDTRQYRSDQPCGDGTKPSCPEHLAPEQSILGAEQRAWLFRRLAESDARWNVLAQQVMVARLRGITDEGEETWSMDKWDGYPLERRALLEHLHEQGTPNPVVLTGDIHSNWVADLTTDFSDERAPVVATEFVGTSISSGGDGRDVSEGARRVLDRNPHLKFYNGQRGYVTADVRSDVWRTEFRVVERVTEPDAPVRTRAAFVVEAGRPGAQSA